MELVAELVVMTRGCTLCYADPKTLTATGSYPKGALEAYSPTLMVAVPKIWDVIRKGLLAKVDHGPKVAKFLVHTALDWKQFAISIGLTTPLFDALVIRKFRAAVGGKLVYALSGGGPLNGEVQDFIRAAFDIGFVQGYVRSKLGFSASASRAKRRQLIRASLCSPSLFHRNQQGLTENCAGTTVQDPKDLRQGIAGAPIPSVQIKLVSTPDIGDKDGVPYMSADRRDVQGNPVFGRGEILMRGGNLSCGYYMEPEKTREVFDPDGWFHTGDIGQFMSDGSLRIVDRMKNLVKLKGGEYIALEKMEMTYGNSSFVDAVAGGICCYGDGDMDRPVAIMELNVVVAGNWAKERGMSDAPADLVKNPDLYKAVMEDLANEHAKSDLSHLEKLVGVALVTDHWTPDNGCLTAANKLQRREVIRQFDKEFQAVKAKGIF
jgi:long-chain acyl-CoA synthetase